MTVQELSQRSSVVSILSRSVSLVEVVQDIALNTNVASGSIRDFVTGVISHRPHDPKRAMLRYTPQYLTLRILTTAYLYYADSLIYQHTWLFHNAKFVEFPRLMMEGGSPKDRCLGGPVIINAFREIKKNETIDSSRNFLLPPLPPTEDNDTYVQWRNASATLHWPSFDKNKYYVTAPNNTTVGGVLSSAAPQQVAAASRTLSFTCTQERQRAFAVRVLQLTTAVVDAVYIICDVFGVSSQLYLIAFQFVFVLVCDWGVHMNVNKSPALRASGLEEENNSKLLCVPFYGTMGTAASSLRSPGRYVEGVPYGGKETRNDGGRLARSARTFGDPDCGVGRWPLGLKALGACRGTANLTSLRCCALCGAACLPSSAIRRSETVAHYTSSVDFYQVRPLSDVIAECECMRVRCRIAILCWLASDLLPRRARHDGQQPMKYKIDRRKPDRFCRPSSNFGLDMISILRRVVRHDAQNWCDNWTGAGYTLPLTKFSKELHNESKWAPKLLLSTEMRWRLKAWPSEAKDVVLPLDKCGCLSVSSARRINFKVAEYTLIAVKSIPPPPLYPDSFNIPHRTLFYNHEISFCQLRNEKENVCTYSLQLVIAEDKHSQLDKLIILIKYRVLHCEKVQHGVFAPYTKYTLEEVNIVEEQLSVILAPATRVCRVVLFAARSTGVDVAILCVDNHVACRDELASGSSVLFAASAGIFLVAPLGLAVKYPFAARSTGIDVAILCIVNHAACRGELASGRFEKAHISIGLHAFGNRPPLLLSTTAFVYQLGSPSATASIPSSADIKAVYTNKIGDRIVNFAGSTAIYLIRQHISVQQPCWRLQHIASSHLLRQPETGNANYNAVHESSHCMFSPAYETYYCDYCNAMFPLSDNLYRYNKKWKGYVCCSSARDYNYYKTFTISSSGSQPEDSNCPFAIDYKTYQCDNCDAVFTRSDSLYRHNKKC
ncbi:hypothetical protein PR048_004216 [Dryococelus australis]|uniref:C2H2-type domain-containing protein n=1 Tax=Dryococelus australis TaxID=614101 RepID=A0ABQ9I4V7_9NEOP|nr:hypothetical protein PR048_004216 [Dryococelus australis]